MEKRLMPIYIDSRGKGELELAKLLEMKKIPVEVKHIDSGDIYFNDIVIERKTISDLTGSVTGEDRHFWEQLKVMKDTYKKVLLIVEGHINWNDRLVSGILYAVVVGWQIPYINTVNIYETATIISKLFDRYGTSKVNDVPPAAVRKAKTVKEIRWSMLQCIAGIGPKGATQVLQEFPEFGNASYNPCRVTTALKQLKIPSKSKELLKKVLTE